MLLSCFQDLLPVNASGIAELAKSVYPTGLPKNATLFLTSNNDLVTAAKSFGLNITTIAEAVKAFQANETALAKLRTVLLYSTLPSGIYTQDELEEIGLDGVPTALEGLKISSNVTGTRVVTGSNQKANILGQGPTDNVFVVDYPLSPKPIETLEGTTADAAQKITSKIV
jgi:hypothetical protein